MPWSSVAELHAVGADHGSVLRRVLFAKRIDAPDVDLQQPGDLARVSSSR